MRCDVDLIMYVPDVLKAYREFKEITETENPELCLVYSAVKGFEDDQFILEATPAGLKRWETMLNIPTNMDDSIEDRKYRVYMRANQTLPYTEVILHQLLEKLMGSRTQFTCDIRYDDYIAVIRLALTSKTKYRDVEELLNSIIPANLIVDLDLLYNQHQTVGQYTHEYLTQFTQAALNNEYLGE